MDLLAQSSLAAARPGKGPGRRGLALPSAMFALVAIGVLLAGIFVFADLNAKTVRNRERATRAVHVAEAGVNHALGLLRGSLRARSFTRILRGADNAITLASEQADDSLFINWPGLSAGDQIPLAGQAYQGHTYFVTIGDDPAETDGNVKADVNGRIRVRCRAVTSDGSTAEVVAIVGAVPMPGITVDGNVSFGNANVITGECGGVHANGNMTSSGGGPTLSGPATATGTITGTFNGTKVPGADAVPVPDLNPLTYCAGADFTLLAGGTGIMNMATGIIAPIGSGWSWDILTQSWKASGTPTLPAAGTYCVQGNAWLAGNVGSSAAPKSISIIASGSIKVDGTPFIQPDHDDGILLLAGGDIFLAGNNTTGQWSYQGMIYAGAQCSLQGNVKTFGQVVCANGAQPAGAYDWAPGNTVSGNFNLTFDCSANVFNKRRVLYWYPRIGT